MIKVSTREKAIRTVEAFNAISVVLPIYDDEARAIFRSAFSVDLADMLPKFFMSMALESIKNEKQFDLYLDFFEQLIKYIRMKRDKLPLPIDDGDSVFLDMRAQAEKFLNAWMVRKG